MDPSTAAPHLARAAADAKAMTSPAVRAETLAIVARGYAELQKRREATELLGLAREALQEMKRPKKKPRRLTVLGISAGRGIFGPNWDEVHSRLVLAQTTLGDDRAVSRLIAAMVEDSDRAVALKARPASL